MTTLSVLIPTYRRPQHAIKAITSALEAGDPRVQVLCSSNLFEPELEYLSERLDGLTYTFFEDNQGVRRNIRALLESSAAEFSLILSDEDRVISQNLEEFLEFLSALPWDTSVVGTPVDGADKNRFVIRNGNYRSIGTVNHKSYVALAPLSTQISGLVFSKRGLHIARNTFDSVFKESEGNAYSHLDLVGESLREGRLVICHDPIVEKGVSAGYGGDSHAHVDGRRSLHTLGGRLNPKTYSPYARVRQYFFQESRLSRLGGISHTVRAVARLRLLTECRVRMQQAVLQSTDLSSLRGQLESAVHDAQAAGEFSASWAAKFVATQVQKDFPWKGWLWALAFFARLMRGVASRLILFPRAVNSHKLFGV